MTRKVAAAMLSCASMTSFCGGPAQAPITAYDLPVKTSGGVEEEDIKPATPLTVTVEMEDEELAVDLVGEIESAIAFDHYGDLNGCESGGDGWETPFAAGTVVITFLLTTMGETEDVEVALTTGDPPTALVKCLGEVVTSMQLSVAPGEKPVTVHLLLRYGD